MSSSNDDLQELVLSSSSLLTSLHDVKTGSLLTAFKSSSSSGGAGSESASAYASTSSSKGKGREESASASSASQWRRTADVVDARDGQGGMVIAALPGGKGALNVWSFQREAPMNRLLLPVKPTCLATSNSGVYLAVGTNDGRLLLWELATGLLLASFDAHYRSVTCLAWTDDDAALVSGGDDAACHVWSLPMMLSAASNPLIPVAPYASLADHTLPISHICVSIGRFPLARVLTASLDGSVKLWDLRHPSVSLVSSFTFPAPQHVTHVEFDVLERTFFAATVVPATGLARVWKVDLYRRVRRGQRDVQMDEVEKEERELQEEDMSNRWIAIGGGGRGEADRILPPSSGDGSVPGRIFALPRVPQPAQSSNPGNNKQASPPPEVVSSLHLSSLSSHLLIGTSLGSIYVLSLPSMQSIRIIQPAQSSSTSSLASPITYIRCLLRPPDLVSRTGSSNGMHAGGKEEAIQPRPVAQQLSRMLVRPFEMEMNPGERVVPIRILRNAKVDEIVVPPISAFSRFAPDKNTKGRRIMESRKAEGGNDEMLIQGIKEENARLREQLAKAVALNDKMWEAVVEKSLAGANSGKKNIPRFLMNQ